MLQTLGNILSAVPCGMRDEWSRDPDAGNLAQYFDITKVLGAPPEAKGTIETLMSYSVRDLGSMMWETKEAGDFQKDACTTKRSPRAVAVSGLKIWLNATKREDAQLAAQAILYHMGREVIQRFREAKDNPIPSLFWLAIYTLNAYYRPYFTNIVPLPILFCASLVNATPHFDKWMTETKEELVHWKNLAMALLAMSGFYALNAGSKGWLLTFASPVSSSTATLVGLLFYRFMAYDAGHFGEQLNQPAG